LAPVPSVTAAQTSAQLAGHLRAMAAFPESKSWPTTKPTGVVLNSLLLSVQGDAVIELWSDGFAKVWKTTRGNGDKLSSITWSVARNAILENWAKTTKIPKPKKVAAKTTKMPKPAAAKTSKMPKPAAAKTTAKKTKQ